LGVARGPHTPLDGLPKSDEGMASGEAVWCGQTVADAPIPQGRPVQAPR